MPNKYMKKCSTPLVKKQMKIQMTLRFYLSPVRIAIFKKTTNSGKGWGGEKEPICTVGGNVN
jgi:hypothetical protein